eukprot:3059019-Pyramimonas_sp.AAC.1
MLAAQPFNYDVQLPYRLPITSESCTWEIESHMSSGLGCSTECPAPRPLPIDTHGGTPYWQACARFFFEPDDALRHAEAE